MGNQPFINQMAAASPVRLLMIGRVVLPLRSSRGIHIPLF